MPTPSKVRRLAETHPGHLHDLRPHAPRRSLALEVPYDERRRLLEGLELGGAALGDAALGDRRRAARCLKAAHATTGLEGVVAKRLDSPYRPGRRDPSWVKVKNFRTQSVVIGGWAAGQGHLEGDLGALLLGIPGPRWPDLRGQGRDRLQRRRPGRAAASRLDQLRRDTSPFAGAVPRSEAAGVTWVEPELVGEVRFTEWTRTGRLRQPAWRGCAPTSDPRRSSVSPEQRTVIEVEGRRLTVSNLDKVLYPEAGFTKADVIWYYVHVAPVLLPHRAGPPADHSPVIRTGWTGESFFEKHTARKAPDWDHGRSACRGERRADGDTTSSSSSSSTICRPSSGLPTWPRSSCTCPCGARSTEGSLRPVDLMVFDLDPGAAGDRRRVLRGRAWLRQPSWRAVTWSPIRRRADRRDCSSTPALDPPWPWEEVACRRATTSPGRWSGSTRRGALEHAQGPPQGQGAHRLEPEPRRQDDDRALLAAALAVPDGVDAPDLGRGGVGRATVGERSFVSWPATCSSGSSRSATCSPR